MDSIKLDKIKKLMEEKGVDQLLLADSASLFYLAGKWVHPGERLYALVINKADDNLDMYVHEMFSIDDVEGVNHKYYKDTDNPVEKLAASIKDSGTVSIDSNWPARFLIKLIALKPNVKFVSEPIIEKVRQIKSEDERQLMREASKLNDKAVEMMSKSFDPSWTEKEATAKLAETYAQLGTSLSFEPIICYGANTADAHHITDESIVKDGEAVMFDIGCIKNGYCSDMTRTFFWKTVSDKQREIYNIVLEANERAIAAVKPGMKYSEIDAIARDYITEKGYGQYFTHRLGHNIGMEVHEAGDVSATNDALLEEGMIFSIEPGIYLPGEFGVRIEDLILVTADGYENLNAFSKELQVIGV